MDQAWAVRQKNFTPSIEFDIPSDTKAVSLTDDHCSLDCAHCGGHYLKGMTPISQLKDSMILEGSSSCLISGGCNKSGVVEFGRQLQFIKGLKEDSKKINMHVGLIEEEEIKKIVNLADCVSFDFVADDETIHEVYGLSRRASDYIRTYKNLRKYVKVLPHICIGLKGGEIRGEYESIRVLKEIGTDGLVFIVFIPTPGTRYAHKNPPKLENVVEILARARIEFPDIPIHLGCMRPKGRIRAEIDYYAIQCGINKLVNPTSYGVRRAEELGLSIAYGRECCVL